MAGLIGYEEDSLLSRGGKDGTVVVGATGNVGTALLRRLAVEPRINTITGIARGAPRSNGPVAPNVDWRFIDVGRADPGDQLTKAFDGADAVIHLAWQLQPSYDRDSIRRTNVDGTSRVIESVRRAAVPTLVVASSVGAYAPGPKEPRVEESWPTTGVPGSTYSDDKAAVEALLD